MGERAEGFGEPLPQAHGPRTVVGLLLRREAQSSHHQSPRAWLGACGPLGKGQTDQRVFSELLCLSDGTHGDEAVITHCGVCQGLGEGPGHRGHQRLSSPQVSVRARMGRITSCHLHRTPAVGFGAGGGCAVGAESLWDPRWSGRGHGRASRSRLRAPTPTVHSKVCCIPPPAPV